MLAHLWNIGVGWVNESSGWECLECTDLPECRQRAGDVCWISRHSSSSNLQLLQKNTLTLSEKYIWQYLRNTVLESKKYSLQKQKNTDSAPTLLRKIHLPFLCHCICICICICNCICNRICICICEEEDESGYSPAGLQMGFVLRRRIRVSIKEF